MSENFITHLNALSFSPTFFALTETWIFDFEEKFFHVDGYCMLANSNNSYRAGGAAVFVKDNIPVENFSKLDYKSMDALKFNIKINR